jgi:hypothetical protein
VLLLLLGCWSQGGLPYCWGLAAPKNSSSSYNITDPSTDGTAAAQHSHAALTLLRASMSLGLWPLLMVRVVVALKFVID